VTTRLYYTDAAVRSFDGVVQACEAADGRFLVRLDRTAFYPSSGGQPFDTGRLDDVPVVDVIDDINGDVVHVTMAPLAPGTRVHGAIDWARRFDHMQQHSGQHVISAVFDGRFGVATVSFHLGADVSTIDLGRAVTDREVAEVEIETNRIIGEDRPVEVRFVSAEAARGLPLRKQPEREGEIRLVEIQDCDLSACGGTHVRATGGIGGLVVTGAERFKGGTRLGFACGGRAVASHGRLRDVVAAAGRALSAGPADIAGRIEQIQHEARERERAMAAMRGDVAALRARAWRDAAETIGTRRVVIRVDVEQDAAASKTLAQAVVADGGLVAVIIGGGVPAPVVAARSADVAWDAGAFVRAMTAALGGRGGGRPELAQAGIPVDADRIVAFVRQAIDS
jgi:alanyl-tRNA synthetase